MHVCMREDVWKGTLVFPHVLPHAHMMSVSSLTGCTCVCEGECVEGYAHLSTSPPSYTHAILSGLLIRVDWAISMCLPCLSDIYFCTGSVWALGALLGGPHVVIGSLFDGLMALLQSHSMFWVLGDLEGLMWPFRVCSMG